MPDPVAVNSMFARIAGRYDLGNRVLSMGVDRSWRRKLVWAVVAHNPLTVLDLATGSGDVAFALADALRPPIRIIGMDFCLPMLEAAEAKKRAATPERYAHVFFQPGDGLALPLADQSVDAVTISFGLRNMADRHRSLGEMQRVLRPGGRAYILEFSQPQWWMRPFYLFYLRRVLPRLAGWLTGDRAAYVYLNESIEAFPGRTALAAEMRAAGFTDVAARGLTGGIVALHSGARADAASVSPVPVS